MNSTPAMGFLEKMMSDPSFRANITHVEKVPAREPDFRPLPGDLSEELVQALASRGIRSLWSHQAETYELSRSGKHVCAVTPTASGKTLCYNLPVLQTLLEKPHARALYFFPTKALSQDQQAELSDTILSRSLPVKAYTYDGDTPDSLRIAARDQGRIVITNPDMLHSGVLPNHTKWTQFFSNLEYVVVDEMHAYRGVFGSHVANVFRRLKRIAAFYGSYPKFILCSATIGNPGELASDLTGEEVTVVGKSGAPSGEKRVIFYNPPLVDAQQGLRKSSASESERIALLALKSGVKTILFARSRIRTELIAAGINQTLENVWTDNSRIRVEPYRGGFLPSERREIERGLREGHVHGVVSTNALELGIDIGGLDCAVMAGFPSGFASFWQQAGRAGRRQDLSVAVFVASQAPLDQYLMRHPGYFFGKSPERARIDPDNPYIARDHVRCAVFEMPFRDGESGWPCAEEALPLLEEEGMVRHSGGRWFWSDRGYPAEGISLRSAQSDNVVIVDATNGANRVIGEIDRPGAKETVYDDAVYIHRGRQYIVLKLDLENRVCKVEEREVNYYTDAVTKTDLAVLSEDSSNGYGPFRCVSGDVLVRTQAMKFKKLKFHTHENVGYGEIFLPEEEMHTRACALILNDGGEGDLAFAGFDAGLRGNALAGLAHAVKETAPVFLSCESRDLGVSERVRDPHFASPAVFFYDRYPGGTGLADALAERMDECVSAAMETVRACPCVRGCPSCIGAAAAASPDTGTGGAKGAVEILLAALLKGHR